MLLGLSIDTVGEHLHHSVHAGEGLPLIVTPPSAPPQRGGYGVSEGASASPEAKGLGSVSTGCFASLSVKASSQKVGETSEVLIGFTLVATSCQDFGGLVPRIIEMIRDPTEDFCWVVLGLGTNTVQLRLESSLQAGKHRLKP